MSETAQLDVNSTPLAQIDVSDASIYGSDSWQPWFARLRKEAPVHYCAHSPLGPYWSVTNHDLIKQVDSNYRAFSSADGIAIVSPLDRESQETDVPIENFISMDPPEHDIQRATVAPSVAPANLANLEPLIRERVADILDHLPVLTARRNSLPARFDDLVNA